MKYSIIFDKLALHFLENLDKPLRKRIFEKIMSTEENPYHFFERLEGRTDFKLRIGSYRAIADINEKGKRIEITFIEHRSKVYVI